MPIITINVDTSGFQSGFERLLRVTQDLTPAMDEIGLKLAGNAKERFRTAKAPDGSQWKARKYETPETAGRGILVRGDHLRDSITRRVGTNQVEVGTNMVYAAIHQFGGKTKPHKIAAKRGKSLAFGLNPNAKKAGDPWMVRSVNHPGSDIPARPYLGVSPADEADIADIIETHIEATLP